MIAPSRPDLTISRAGACRAPLTPWLPTWKIRVVPVDGGDDVEALVDRVGHRLLDVDVLAGGERVERHLPVPVVRRGDEHRVDALVVEQAPVVGGDGGRACGRSGSLRPRSARPA